MLTPIDGWVARYPDDHSARIFWVTIALNIVVSMAESRRHLEIPSPRVRMPALQLVFNQEASSICTHRQRGLRSGGSDCIQLDALGVSKVSARNGFAGVRILRSTSRL